MGKHISHVNFSKFFHRVESVKQRITDFVLSESEQYLGEAMTYTLFESVKEKMLDLVSNQPDTLTEKVVNEPTHQVIWVLINETAYTSSRMFLFPKYFPVSLQYNYITVPVLYHYRDSKMSVHKNLHLKNFS